MKKTTIAAGLAAFAMAGMVIAQQAGFTRTALQTHDLSTPGRVVVQARAEFDPGVAAGRHTHPGEEIGYVLEGQLELLIDGQPPRLVKAGEVFFVPAGLCMTARTPATAKPRCWRPTSSKKASRSPRRPSKQALAGSGAGRLAGTCSISTVEYQERGKHPS